MKTSNKILLIAFAVTLIGITIFVSYFKKSVFENCVEAKGPVVEKLVKTDHFKGIISSNNLNIEITQDTIQKVVISAEENLIDNFTVIVKDDQLKVSRIYCTRKSKNALIKISVDTLEKIKVQSGGKLRSTNTIQGESIDIDASGGGQVNMTLAYKAVFCNLSAGAMGILEGQANRLRSEINSGSQLQAGNLNTKNCDLTASSGANAEVNASEELIVNATSGANIRYKGEPVTKKIDVNSGAMINGMNKE